MLSPPVFLGDLDATGWLVIGLIALCSVAGFVLVVVFICAKVFGRRGADVVAINLGREEGGER
ncbi:MAG TPA: hypothetical protein VF611_12875 [Pyrinomonadaceae bacterium]|jgi:uncharacterized membrane protein